MLNAAEVPGTDVVGERWPVAVAAPRLPSQARLLSGCNRPSLCGINGYECTFSTTCTDYICALSGRRHHGSGRQLRFDTSCRLRPWFFVSCSALAEVVVAPAAVHIPQVPAPAHTMVALRMARRRLPAAAAQTACMLRDAWRRLGTSSHAPLPDLHASCRACPRAPPSALDRISRDLPWPGRCWPPCARTFPCLPRTAGSRRAAPSPAS